MAEPEQGPAGGSERPRSTWELRATPSPEHVQEVLSVIFEYEAEPTPCSSYVVDWETGLDPTTVDDVLEYLWMADMIECRTTPGASRFPAASDMRRVRADRPRLWGPWGRYRSTRDVPRLLGA
jgi:hypothetical protein